MKPAGILWLAVALTMGAWTPGEAAAREVPELVRALDDESATARVRAAQGLLNIREHEKEAVSTLLRALGESDASVRSEAVVALSRYDLTSEEVLTALVRALGDRDDQVRAKAASGLGGKVPRATTAIPALIQALKDPVPEVRRAAAESLGYMPDADPARPYLQHVAESDHSGNVREAARHALAMTESHGLTPKDTAFWIVVPLFVGAVGVSLVLALRMTFKVMKALNAKFDAGRASPETTPLAFLPAKRREIVYNLTRSLELGSGALTATGRKQHFTENIEIGRTGGGDPAKDALWAGTVHTGNVQLEVGATQIRLTDGDGYTFFPRECLQDARCLSAEAEAKTTGASSSLIYVCLHFTDERLGTVVIDAVPFTVGIASILGTQQENRYPDAFAKSEARAREVASALGIPYNPNYYTGAFAWLGNVYR